LATQNTVAQSNVKTRGSGAVAKTLSRVCREPSICASRLFHEHQQGVTAMPVLLWFGIPVLIVGSGFVIYRIVGG
jgi:hypothetical protein